jgi:hypothetical protein
LDAIEHELFAPITSLFADHSLPESPFVFAAFVIRKEPGGRLDLLELQFVVDTAPGGDRTIGEPHLIVHMEGAVPRGRFAFSLGGDCLTKGLEQKLDPDLPDEAVLAGIDGIFKAAKAESPVFDNRIGGPIDVCAIESTGFRWLRRKPDPPAVVPSVEQAQRTVNRFSRLFVVGLGLIGALGIFQMGLAIWLSSRG